MTSRRTILLRSTGALAVTTGLAFGSGAFSRTEADREFDLQIAADDNALLALEPSGVDSAVVTTTDDGRDLLTFDSGDLGLNTQATSTLGRFENVDFNDPVALLEEAFVIRNNTSEAIDVTLSVAVDQGDADIKFVLTTDDPGSNDVSISGDTESTTNSTGRATISGLPSGDPLYGGVLIKTNGTTDLGATINISGQRTGTGEPQ